MRIGFDAKRYFENKTGLGSYSKTLIDGLIENYPDNEYFLYTPNKPQEKHINKLLDISKVKIRYPLNASKSYWRSRGIIEDLKKDNIQVYHGLSNELPFGIHKTNIKTVVTIHDLLFKKFPEDYPLIDRMIFEWKSKYACTRADKIISISEATQAEVLKHYKTSTKKVSTIYQDLSPHFIDDLDSAETKEMLRKLNIDFDFLLFIGNNKRRKNLKTVLQTLVVAKTKRHLILVLPSKELSSELTKYVKENNLETYIHILTDLSINQMKVLYKLALALIYPSLGEGWGLPVEEALVFKKYVIVPRKKPFTEVPSKYKVFIEDPLDPYELSEKIEYASSQENSKLDLRNNNSTHVKNASSLYNQTYQSLL